MTEQFGSIFTNLTGKESVKYYSQIFDKIGAVKYFAKFTGKHLRWSLFFNKVAGLIH